MATHGFGDSDVRRLRRSVQRTEKLHANLKPGSTRGQRSRKRSKTEIVIQNDSGETMPAFCVAKVKEATRNGYKKTIICEKPDTDFNADFIINWGGSIPDKGTSKYEQLKYQVALYDEAETPANGETWGPANGSWKLTKGGPGFVIIGGLDADSKTVVVAPKLSGATIITTALVNKASGVLTSDTEFNVDNVDDRGYGLETSYEDVENTHSWDMDNNSTVHIAIHPDGTITCVNVDCPA